MRAMKRVISCLLIVIMVATILPMSIAADDSPQIGIYLSQTTGKAGDIVYVMVNTKNAASLAGIQFAFTYVKSTVTLGNITVNSKVLEQSVGDAASDFYKKNDGELRFISVCENNDGYIGIGNVFTAEFTVNSGVADGTDLTGAFKAVTTGDFRVMLGDKSAAKITISNDGDVKPSAIAGGVYTLDMSDKNNAYIKSVPEKTKVKDFLTNLNVDGITVTKDGNACSDDDYIGTGCVVSGLTMPCTVIVKGDINGDGEISSKDLTVLKRYAANSEKYSLDTSYLIGANINEDEGVSSKDITVLKRYLSNPIKYPLS